MMRKKNVNICNERVIGRIFNWCFRIMSKDRLRRMSKFSLWFISRMKFSPCLKHLFDIFLYSFIYLSTLFCSMFQFLDFELTFNSFLKISLEGGNLNSSSSAINDNLLTIPSLCDHLSYLRPKRFTLKGYKRSYFVLRELQLTAYRCQ